MSLLPAIVPCISNSAQAPVLDRCLNVCEYTMMSAVQAEREKASEARGSLCLDWAAEYWGQKQPAIVKCAQAKPFDQIDGLNMCVLRNENFSAPIRGG